MAEAFVKNLIVLTLHWIQHTLNYKLTEKVKNLDLVIIEIFLSEAIWPNT